MYCFNICCVRKYGETSLLRVFAGSNEIERSCESDVEHEAVVVLDDSPGTTNATNEVLSSAEGLIPIFWSDVAHDHWDTHT